MAAIDPVHSGRQQLLATFRLRDAYYAVDAVMVLEVIRPGEITPIPHGPTEVMGVINLRGRIVTLFDMGMLLGFAAAERTQRSRILIVEDRGEFTGLLVDEVAEVAEVFENELQPPPANVPAEWLRYCKAVYRADSRVVLILDATMLLQPSQAAGATSAN